MRRSRAETFCPHAQQQQAADNVSHARDQASSRTVGKVSQRRHDLLIAVDEMCNHVTILHNVVLPFDGAACHGPHATGFRDRCDAAYPSGGFLRMKMFSKVGMDSSAAAWGRELTESS